MVDENNEEYQAMTHDDSDVAVISPDLPEEEEVDDVDLAIPVEEVGLPPVDPEEEEEVDEIDGGAFPIQDEIYEAMIENSDYEM